MIKITLFTVLISVIVLLSCFAPSFIKAGGGGGGSDPSIALDGILDLTPDNFNDYISASSDKAALVEFYAPWCGHCKSLSPELAKLGKAVKGNSKVVVAKVNADAHGELGSRFGVQGFPTLKFFPAGSLSAEEYNGGRDAKSFIKFLNDKVSNAGIFLPYEHSDVKVISGLASHDQVVGDKTKKITFVKYYAPWCGHCKAIAPAWNSLAGVFKNDRAIVTIADCDADQEVNKPVASKVGVQGFPTMKYYVNGGEAQEYNGGRTLEDLIAFVNEKSGLHRSADGGLAAGAGVTSELSELAAQFVAAAAADRAGIEAKINAAAGSDASLDWFKKIAASIIAKGDSYVEAELGRVNKILSGGNLAGAKRDSLSLKRNALNAFKKN
jgi:protein disulfide-isomerase A6